MDSDALDRYITSGRYSKRSVLVKCPACEEKTQAVFTEEYGAGEIDPDVCSSCGAEFPSVLDMEDNEPDVDEYPRWSEDDREW